MASTQQRILYLLQNYTAGTASEAEKEELWDWFGLPKDEAGDEIFRTQVEQLLSEYVAGDTEESPDWERIFAGILKKRGESERKYAPAPVRRIPIVRRLGWVAAAVIALVGTYVLIMPKRVDKEKSVANLQKANDVPPGGNKATLTLSNGSQIILDSAHNGTLAQQGSTEVVKPVSGILAYNVSPVPILRGQESPANDKLPASNTLSTPRGGQYQLTLPDGTKVWLNAASSITYPTVFSGKERKVTITGEVFFIVKHNEKMPFRVVAAGQLIEDLGTEFNVNAYSDEPSEKTTLLQGKVQINKRNLKPGQQAVTKDNKTTINSPDDLEEVIAWKKGQFLFNGADLKTILRQAARWYDVDIEFKGDINETFTGNISRQENASQLLHILELTKKVRFEIEEKNIRVIPL